jgi:hypothetical protein
LDGLSDDEKAGEGDQAPAQGFGLLSAGVDRDDHLAQRPAALSVLLESNGLSLGALQNGASAVTELELFLQEYPQASPRTRIAAMRPPSHTLR